MNLVISLTLSLLGCVLLILSMRRGAGSNAAVALTLLDDECAQHVASSKKSFISGEEQRCKNRFAVWLVGATVLTSMQVVCIRLSLVPVIVSAITGACAAELYAARRRDAARKYLVRRMEFYLPTVMERIVMGVGTGLDIIPALREASRAAADPVSELLRWIVELSEEGLPVEIAFENASRKAEAPSVKHAFIHLGLAYRQGGEIVRPLKELSDATQLAYQELIEEQIARLPVKAVLPLVVTFTGLIVCFLTVPLMQVSSMTKTVIHAAK